MDIRAKITSLAAFLMMMPVYGHDIYKCTVNGAVKYQEEKCDENSKPIKLKDMAAPIQSLDTTSSHHSAYVQDSQIKERIARRQKKINRYRKKMQTEIDAIEKPTTASGKKYSKPRNSVKEQDTVTQVKKIAGQMDKENAADQINAVVNKYRALIEAEQFQIKLLQQELKMNQELNTPPIR